MKRYGPPKLEESYSRDEIYKAFYEADAHVPTIADALCTTKTTIYNFLDRSPEAYAVFREAKKYKRRAKVDRMEEVILQHAEEMQNASISLSAAKYYVEAHGKDEGWGGNYLEDESKKAKSENDALWKKAIDTYETQSETT